MADEKPRCKRGHLMTLENTYTPPRGGTACFTCRRECNWALKAKRGVRPRQQFIDAHRLAVAGTSGRFPEGVLNYNFPRIKFCGKGHAVIGDNFAIKGHEIRCRVCLRMKEHRFRKSGNLKEGVVRQVLLGLEEGKTFSNLGGKGSGKFIVNGTRLIAFCDANPKLGTRIRALAEKNRMAAQKQNGDRARLAAAPAILRNNGADAFDVIQRVTAHLWEGERGDVMSLMFVAVAEGRMKISDCDQA